MDTFRLSKYQTVVGNGQKKKRNYDPNKDARNGICVGNSAIHLYKDGGCQANISRLHIDVHIV